MGCMTCDFSNIMDASWRRFFDVWVWDVCPRMGTTSTLPGGDPLNIAINPYRFASEATRGSFSWRPTDPSTWMKPCIDGSPQSSPSVRWMKLAGMVKVCEGG